MTKLIYIGGYGRSGSTLLEYLLTAHPDVVACGEIERHVRSTARQKLCTCGRPMQDCPVWAAFPHKKRTRGVLDHAGLTLAVRDRVASEYAVMIDSSKTAWGSSRTPFHLYRELGSDFLLVHIVRDPRGVCWSAMRPLSKNTSGSHQAARALRTAIGWAAANLACERFGRGYPENYLRVRYEDLVQAPDAVLGVVLRKVSLSPPGSFESTGAADNRHQLYGNAMRYKPLVLTRLKEDTAWRSDMPGFYRRLVDALCCGLSRKYGYR